MNHTSTSTDWTARITAVAGVFISLVSLAAALGYLHPFRNINRVTSTSLLPAFVGNNECFGPRNGTLRFFYNRENETQWVQCKTQNGLANSSTYVFRIADLIRDDISADYRIVGIVGTFGVEVFSFEDGGLLHWVVRVDGKPICTVPQNGARLTISSVSVGPGECELVDEVRPSLSESDFLTIDQVVDAPRDPPNEFVFGGIVRPEVELQKK